MSLALSNFPFYSLQIFLLIVEVMGASQSMDQLLKVPTIPEDGISEFI